MKMNSKISHAEEQEFYENLSHYILEQISEINIQSTITNLEIIANILSHFKNIENYNSNNFSFSQPTKKNLQQIGQSYLKIFNDIYLNVDHETETQKIDVQNIHNYFPTPDQTIRYLEALNYVDVIPRFIIDQIFYQLNR